MIAGEQPEPPTLSEADIQRIANFLQSAPARGGSGRLFDLFSRLGLKRDETQTALADMSLPVSLEEQFITAFGGAALKLEKASVEDRWSSTLTRSYTKVLGPNVSLVLLSLPRWFLDDTSTIGNLYDAVFKILNVGGRIITQGRSDYPIQGWIDALETSFSKNGVAWRFVDWNNIDRALAGKLTLHEVFRIQRRPGANGWATSEASGLLTLRLDADDKRLLIEILAPMYRRQRTLFGNLMNGADIPGWLQDQINLGLQLDNRASTIHFIEALADANSFAKESSHSGDTFLGWVLHELLQQVGNPVDEILVRIISDYELIKNEGVMANVRRKIDHAG
jgi:hypothetical protein